MTAVRYFSALDAGGYAQAGFGYVRALVNAGIRVHWTPFLWPRNDHNPTLLSTDAALRQPIVASAENDVQLGDLAALINATQQPITADTTIFHTVPEHWPLLENFTDKASQRIGMTVWETTRLPAHWLPRIDRVHRVCVPCEMNREVFVASGVTQPVNVVPHVRRNRWSEFGERELSGFRSALELKNDCFTFYSINTWTIRKNIPLLLRAFCRAFGSDEAVQLIIKTSRHGDTDTQPHQRKPSGQLCNAIVREELARDGNACSNIRLIADDALPTRSIDALHCIGDCFVSLTHGEGFGLGAFDAATYGNPVVTPGFAGARDIFPDSWAGNVAHTMTSAPIWPTFQPSYWSDQDWAHVELQDAIESLRHAYRDVEARRTEALAIQADIAHRFSETRIASQLISAIQGRAA
jgi:glycosyltransferase involved in cell wall biosynthesis